MESRPPAATPSRESRAPTVACRISLRGAADGPAAASAGIALRTVTLTRADSPGRSTDGDTSTASGARAPAAAFAISDCQNSPNPDWAASRNRHASRAPLTISWPAPTFSRHTNGCARVVSPRAGAERASTVVPAGRGTGQASSLALSVAVSGSGGTMAATPPVTRASHRSAAVRRTTGPCGVSSNSSTTAPPRRRMNESSARTSPSASDSVPPTTITSNAFVAARSSRRAGGRPKSLLRSRDVVTRLVTVNRASASSARRTNVDIHDTLAS